MLQNLTEVNRAFQLIIPFQLLGFVELVTESDTLRKIQIKHGRGVAGSFKDTTIREWLQIQNPTQLEYEKVRTHYD